MKKFKTPQWLIITYIVLEYYFGFVRSWWIAHFRSIKRPATFFGLGASKYAALYSKKRTRKWKSYWDQSGRQQGVMPFSPTKLIVCSKVEYKEFQRLGFVGKKHLPNKAMRKAYYKTKL